MGQSINVENLSIAGKSVNAYTKDKVSEASSLSSGDDGSSYIYDGAPSKQTRVNKTMDQFEEYLKNQQEKAKEAGEDEASQEKADKEAAKEIRNNLSSEELKQLEMMGVDVESARLSDIMGMVNTMRGKNHRQETQELLAQIKADSGDVDKLMVTGGGVKVAGTDVVLDDVSVADVAAKKSSKTSNQQDDLDFTPGKNELVYMVKNNMPLNRENLYKAHFSGEKAADGRMDDETFNALSGQIQQIIETTGIENFDMDDARFLMDNDLPVNPDAIKLVSQYKRVENQPVNSADIPENDEESVERAAQELYNKVLFLEPEIVQEAAQQMADDEMKSGNEAGSGEAIVKISIQAAYTYQINNTKTSDKENRNEDRNENTQSLSGLSASGITAKKQLLEIQLSMTLQVANRMAKLDINVDTKGLSETLDVLRKAERELLKESLANSGVEPTDENADMLSETIAGVEKLGRSDASVLSTMLGGGAFTIRSLNAAEDEITEITGAAIPDASVTGAADDIINEKTSEDVQAGDSRNLMQTQDVTASQSADAQIKQNLQRSFESVKRSYEAVGTAPRSDMGDSITKAFANIDELLGELDIDVNYESRRAARILGYNNMEITQENIDSIVGYDREVNRLMDNFYPEAVMGIIKDGINPMDVSIDQLNDIISQKNYNGGVSDAKNFATYLRDVEKRGEITDEERESYIGIYRVMDKLAKSGDREAGYVFANQANLTIRNMISAMRSRKAKGIDVDVDDSFGMLEDVKGYGVRMDEQIEAGFESGSNSNAGSNTSSNTNPDANANTSSNENSNASSNANSNTNELARQLERYRQLNPNVESFIQENEIQYNMNNAFAVDALLNEDEGVYKLIYEAMQKLDFKDESEENLIDEETGNMAASLMGEDVDIDPFAALESENLMRQLSEGGDLSLTYEDIEKQLTELMYDAGAAGLISSLDISAIKAASAGVSLLGQMSKQDSYQIPVDTAQGTTVVNLTLKNAERGSAASMSDGISPTVIEANMKSDTVGNLTAKIEVTSTVDGDLDVIGEFVSDSSEGNEILQGMTDVVEKLKSSLQGVFAANTKSVSINISFGTKALNENSYAKASGSAGVSRGTACRAAVDVVRTMTDVMEIFTGNF